MVQPDHSYTFVNQQMALQHGGTDLGQFGTTAAGGVGSQQNGGFVPPHHHQVALQVFRNIALSRLNVIKLLQNLMS